MRVSRAVGAAVSVGLLGGCATFHQAHQVEVQTTQEAVRHKVPRQPPVVQTVSTPYLLGAPVAVRHPLPAILRQPIHIGHYRNLSLTEAATLISQTTGPWRNCWMPWRQRIGCIGGGTMALCGFSGRRPGPLIFRRWTG